jgi:hypothetical protein
VWRNELETQNSRTIQCKKTAPQPSKIAIQCFLIPFFGLICHPATWKNYANATVNPIQPFCFVADDGETRRHTGVVYPPPLVPTFVGATP